MKLVGDQRPLMKNVEPRVSVHARLVLLFWAELLLSVTRLKVRFVIPQRVNNRSCIDNLTSKRIV